MDPQAHCPNGHLISSGGRFCPECGAIVVAAPGPMASAVTPPRPDRADGTPAPPASAMPAAPSGANSPRARWWSRRRIALVGSASVLAIAAVAVGIVVATGGRDDVPAFALTEPAPQTAVEAATATCYDDYTWAVGEMGDNGDSGILTVANAWGNQDGRLQQARQFLSDFTAERSRTDDQSAIQAMIQQVYDYCAELNGLVPRTS